MMKYMLALEALEAVARANEAVAEQIFKALDASQSTGTITT